MQQLHLNGNLVDAVSTNEVFLQSGSSNRRGNSTNMATHNSINMLPNNKLQAAFNNYSLNMPLLNNKHHTISVAPTSTTVPTGAPNNSSIQQSVRNNFKRTISPHVNSAAAGVDLDFMDADIIDDIHDGNAIMGSVTGAVPTATADAVATAVAPSSNPTGKKSWKQPVQKSSGRKPPSSSNSNTPSVHNDSEESSSDEDEDDDDEPRKQEGYIDDPARRLYVMDHEEHKPFKCPVIGCDKTYKNQNGLKYHKLHGHQNQKLHENPDGTFSIIDPESNEPYPDGMGFEKDKPYRCEVCGKRYKNLNGLKYHRGHSTH